MKRITFNLNGPAATKEQSKKTRRKLMATSGMVNRAVQGSLTNENYCLQLNSKYDQFREK